MPDDKAKFIGSSRKIAVNDTKIYGYMCGGSNWQWDDVTSDIRKIYFSTDTVDKLSSTISRPRTSATGFANSINGYIGGGYTDGYETFSNTIERINIRTAVSTELNTTLTQPKGYLSSFKSRHDGFFVGGQGDSRINEIEKFQYSNEHSNLISATLTTACLQPATFSSSTYGYSVGGVGTGNPANLTTIDKLNFSNETISLSSTSLNSAQKFYIVYSFYNSSHGYTGEGSYLNKLNYSDDTIVTIQKSLRVSDDYVKGMNSRHAGYCCGGNLEVQLSKLDFNNDTITIIWEEPNPPPVGYNDVRIYDPTCLSNVI